MKRFHNLKTLLQKNGLCYLSVLLFVLSVRHCFRRADPAHLQWLLAPTAWWVQKLTGLSFVWNRQAGYINHSRLAIIAPSCSGIRFFLLATSALIFSYVHTMKQKAVKIFWMIVSPGIAYLLTILVNSVRISLSLLLPQWLEDRGYFLSVPGGRNLHTALGVILYFSSLLLLCHIVGKLLRKPAPLWVPCLCYLGTIALIPLCLAFLPF